MLLPGDDQKKNANSMREKPNRQNVEIEDCLVNQYGLQVDDITFLPQGGDINAFVYHIITKDRTSYFLKLRKGVFNEISHQVLDFLSSIGIREIIAPARTKSGQVWTQLGDFKMILYPFIEGHNGFEAALSESQWVAFGAALKAIHTAEVPTKLGQRVKVETYTSKGRGRVKTLLKRARKEAYLDPVAAQYAGFIGEKAEEILYIVQRAEHLSSILQVQNPPFVFCHSDLHAGNLLIDVDNNLYIVDWDEPIFAAKERDLMFIGGGVGSTWYAPEEEAQFYQGYGPTEINQVALAYYRFERIVQDIADWGELILFTEKGGADRARWLQGLKRWFLPNDVVAMAYQAEKNLPSKI